jgi:hypothetical protein
MSPSRLMLAALAVLAASSAFAAETGPLHRRAMMQPAQGPSAGGAALGGLKVFGSGEAAMSSRPAPRLARTGDAEIGGGLSRRTGSPDLALTPRKPSVNGRGWLELGNADTWLAPGYGFPDGGAAGVSSGSGSAVVLVLQASAGQTYLIDESVQAVFAGHACAFKVSGPDGSTTTVPCADAATQHLVFAYAATKSGLARFGTSVSGASQGLFFAAAVSPAK